MRKTKRKPAAASYVWLAGCLCLAGCVWLAGCASTPEKVPGEVPEGEVPEGEVPEGEVPEQEGEIRPEVVEMRARLEAMAAEEAPEEAFLELAAAPMARLAFDLRLEEIEIPGAPGLHSYSAAATRDGKWLILGGRTNGLHNLTGRSFPEDQRNTDIWVLDPDGGQACSVPLNGLLQNVYDALAATNHQHTQVGDVLWITGGYGWSDNAADNVTFGYALAVDVERLVPAVLGRCGRELPGIESFFSWGTVDGGACALFGTETDAGDSCALTVTGGGMEYFGDRLYLVFGQIFGGRYNDFLHQQQLYTCRVAGFTPPADPDWGSSFAIPSSTIETLVEGDASCKKGGLHPSIDPFHRRDLNVVPSIYLDGDEPTAAAIAYGGVFRLEFFGFTEPVFVTAAGVTVDSSSEQKIGQYEAASLGLFDSRSDTMHTVILGGISANYCTAGEDGVDTPQCTRTKKVFGFPGFIEDGTILSCRGGAVDGDGGFACAGFDQALLYEPFLTSNPDLPTGMQGSGAQFFRRPGIAAYENGVLQLESLAADEETLVGHVFGGIEVAGEAPGQKFLRNRTRSQTQASHRAFAVWIRPR